jgi:hypothetical protein
MLQAGMGWLCGSWCVNRFMQATCLVLGVHAASKASLGALQQSNSSMAQRAQRSHGWVIKGAIDADDFVAW